jgi:hypothetical protein
MSDLSSFNQSGPVWFLAGTFEGSVERECIIPSGEALLFPIYYVIGAFAENPEVEFKEMRSLAKDVIDKVTVKEATIDGRPLKEIDRYKIASDVFNVTYP